MPAIIAATIASMPTAKPATPPKNAPVIPPANPPTNASPMTARIAIIMAQIFQLENQQLIL